MAYFLWNNFKLSPKNIYVLSQSQPRTSFSSNVTLSVSRVLPPFAARLNLFNAASTAWPWKGDIVGGKEAIFGHRIPLAALRVISIRSVSYVLYNFPSLWILALMNARTLHIFHPSSFRRAL